jgi:NTE family protein
MNAAQDDQPAQTIKSLGRSLPGEIVLVLQGGGALGSYQVGVYQALHEAGIEPDWIIGTSIGAINASLIAGNAPEQRLSRLTEFWKRMEQNPAWQLREILSGFSDGLAYWSTIAHGIPGFFRPNPLAHSASPIRWARSAPVTIRRRRWKRRCPSSPTSIASTAAGRA